MFGVDRDSGPVDLVRIFTDVEFLVCYVLPIVLLGAAFAILREKDGQLRWRDCAWYSSLLLLMSVNSAIITFFIEYSLLKPFLGFGLNMSRHMDWSVWLGTSCIFVAFGEREFDRLDFPSDRETQAAVEGLEEKQATESGKRE